MRLLSIFSALFLMPHLLHAEVVVRSPFYFPVQASDYKAVLENYDPLKDLANSRIELIQVSLPYKSAIQGMDLQMSATQRVVLGTELGQMSYTVDVSRVQVNVGKFSTDDAVTQHMGGSTFTVFIKGSCSGLQISSHNSSLKMHIDVEADTTEGHVQLKLKNFDVQGDADWTVNTESCNAFPGYQASVEKGVVEFLKNKESLKNLLAARLESALQNLTGSFNEKILRTKTVQLLQGVRFHIKPRGVSADNNSLMLFGDAEVSMESVKNAEDFVDAPITPAELSQIHSSGLLISQEFVQRVFKHLYSEGYLKKSFSSTAIKGFQDLMKNRLFQFFLWPDLLKFDKNSEFKFDASAQTSPQVNYLQSSKGYSWYNLKDQVTVSMQAPQGAGHIPYVNFQSVVDVNSWMTVANGRLYMGFAQPASKLSALWDSDYLSFFKPKKSINTSTINSALAKAVKNYRMDFNLPVIDLNSSVLKPTEIKPGVKWLQLTYQPQ